MRTRTTDGARHLLVVAIVVGLLSVVSDNLPSREAGVSVAQEVVAYLAVMANSLPVWFALAMVAGHLFGATFRTAALVGSLQAVAAIGVYLGLGQVHDTVVGSSVSLQVSTLVTWGGAAAVGGAVGGIVGWLARRTRRALLVLAGGLVLQLILYGPDSWTHPVGAAQNLTFVVAAGWAARAALRPREP